MNKITKKISIFLLLFLFVFSFLLSNISSINIDDFLSYASINDINYAIKNKIFGNFYTLKIDKNQVHASNNTVKLNLKFLNLITIKSFNINTNDDYIYAGGNAIGITLKTRGVILMGNNSIITKEGLVDTLKDTNLQIGDIILKINDEIIYSIEDISEIINREENCGEAVKITYVRKNNEYETYITPALDVESGEYKLGIWVKNDASGVGTLTYVKENGDFGALGHSININGTKEAYDITNGNVYSCNVIGVNKGKKGKAGELKGLFLQGRNIQGEINKNLSTGIYGNLSKDSNLYDSVKGRKYKIARRFTAHPGKAKILSCIDGNEVKEYDIEIIKTNYQSSSKEKSMVIKIIDKDLLEKTGGIVRGMSGSPIIQNGKIIGAVTHVFINDSTKGFGLYLDWMINN